MATEATGKLVCRKCGGPHITIKCGKDKKPEEPLNKELPKEPIKMERKTYAELRKADMERNPDKFSEKISTEKAPVEKTSDEITPNTLLNLVKIAVEPVINPELSRSVSPENNVRVKNSFSFCGNE